MLPRLLVIVFLFCSFAPTAWGQKKEPPKTNAEALAADPNDGFAWQEYWLEQVRALGRLAANDLPAGQKVLAGVEETLAKYKPTDPAAQRKQAYITHCLVYWKQLLGKKNSSDSLATSLLANPDNQNVITQYTAQILREVEAITNDEPELAELRVREYQATMAQVEATAKEASTKEHLKTERKDFVARVEPAIAAARKNRDRAFSKGGPFVIGTWLQGPPITAQELKGKVLLLNFWAPWCPYCTQTAPKLREWQEKFGDRGLVIVGVTKYHNCQWSEEEQRAVRVTGTKVSPEEDKKIVLKYLTTHQLKHRIGLESPKNELSGFYSPLGVPLFYLIDQQGRIRVKGAAGDVLSIENALESLLPLPVSTVERPTAEPRQWSDDSGTFKIQATFLGQDATSVSLKKADGAEIKVPKARLSAADQAHLKSLEAKP